MADRVHRPPDDEYWIPAWSRVLFSGDVFEAIPFGTQPTAIFTDEDSAPPKHFVGEIAFTYGLLVSPTCDMYDQLSEEASCSSSVSRPRPDLVIGGSRLGHGDD